MNAYRFIFDAVYHYADARPDQAALVFGDRVTTYADLELRARRVANGLTSLGLEPQSRVAILTGTNDVFFEIWLGAALGNFVLTPINARLASPEATYIVNDSQAAVLIVDGPFQGPVEGIADDLTTVRHLISLDTHSEWPIYSQWRDAQSSDSLQATGSPNDTMLQMYTSGAHTHRAISDNTRWQCRENPDRPAGRSAHCR
jgi:acyl-CoA synthetase (AMP-forming)/AMP-acid ligase II